MGRSTLPRAEARLRAFLYQRASVDPLKRATSTAAQHVENARVCEFNGWDVAGSYTDDGISASRHARRSRKGWDDMVAAVDRGEADIIVAWEDSRAYRDLEVYLKLRKLCEKTGVLLCYNGTVYDLSDTTDRFVTGLNALLGEQESEKIRARVLRTTQSNAVKGRPHGRTPFGYRREYDPTTGVLIRQMIFEPEADIVREMAERILGGETTYKIAKDFRDRDVRSATGKPWTAEMVKGILLKPTYIGMRQHQGLVIGKAEWDAILEDTAYLRCERILRNPSRRTNRDSAVVWLLSGIVACSCGGLMRVRNNRQNKAYTCVTNFCTSIKVAKLDDVVQAALLEHVEKPEFAAALVLDRSEDVAQAALDRAAELQQELDEAREAFAGRRLSLSAMSALEASLQPLIDAEHERARDSDVPYVLHRLACAEPREVWAVLDLPQRRAAIRALMTVRLNQAYARGARYVTPDRYTIEFLR